MEKILVIQTAFIGDAILTLPMIEKLKEQFEDCLLDVICIPATEEIFSASPFINEVLVIDKKKAHKSFLKLYKFADEIRKRNYSRIYSPHRSFRTSFVVMQSGVRDTYGFSNSSLFHVYKNIIDYGYDKHEIQRNLDLIQFGYDDDSWRIIPTVNVNKDSSQKVQKFFSERNLDERIIAIAPGSVWATKKYPEKYFKEVISYFTGKSYGVLVIGGQSDKELCERLVQGFQENVISTAEQFTLIETIALLKMVKLLLTNDSAPTHLGVCADVPVLTIFCSTTPSFGFYPYNKKSSYISFDDLYCKPCGVHGYEKCPVSTFDCGFMLKPSILISKMVEILND